MAKMNWPKDRKKAFLWAAEAFGTPYRERTERQKELTSAGFCYRPERCDNERSLFCCLMAQLSDKEFAEISG